MNSFQMINHCNNFIEVSLETKKLVFGKDYLGDFLESIFEILELISFDINKYQKIQRP